MRYLCLITYYENNEHSAIVRLIETQILLSRELNKRLTFYIFLFCE